MCFLFIDEKFCNFIGFVIIIENIIEYKVFKFELNDRDDMKLVYYII